MKKRHDRSRRTPRDSFFVAGHLTDESLLLAIDGELTAKQAAETKKHIEACWSCRSREQVLVRRIAEFVAYQDSLAEPFLPPPPGTRSLLLARLDEAAAKTEQPALFGRWFSAVLNAFRANQFAALAGGLTVLAVISSWYVLRTIPTVSAREALDRTALAESSELHGMHEPVVIQKLRITAGKKSITRTLYHDIARNRMVARSDSKGAEDATLQDAYAKSSLAWNSMLDAQTYRQWRAKQDSGTDRVSFSDRGHLKLATVFDRGPVKEADLIIRLPEYHATAEELKLEDNTVIEIAEVSRDVIPFAFMTQNVFGDSMEPAVLGPAPSLNAKSDTVLPAMDAPDDAELAKAQLQAESELHVLGADLGEQISVTTHSGQNVVVAGVVRDTERKSQLIAALKDLPHLQLNFATIEEASERSASSDKPSTEQAAEAPTVMAVAPPLLDGQLNSRFPDGEQRLAYVNQTLSIMQLASSRAWALKRLADRHSPQQVALLDQSSKNGLKVLLADHSSALREDVGLLDRQLRELIDSPKGGSSANDAVGAPETQRIEASEDWRDRARRIQALSEAAHGALVSLITTSQPDNRADSAAVQADLIKTLAQLQIELNALDENLGNNL